MLLRLLALALTTSLLAACATPPSTPSQTSTPAYKPPKAEANANWQNLGVSPNGNILNELDQLSLQREGNLVTFRDKKTIFNPKMENFQSTPSHKYSINTWQIDCNEHTFRLLSVKLFDEGGKQIASYTYNDAQIKAMPVVKNSASFQQMKFVCGNQAI